MVLQIVPHWSTIKMIYIRIDMSNTNNLGLSILIHMISTRNLKQHKENEGIILL